tara:strand:- start:1486 stop:2046 length:561 start_codon:yes stop_codon:yes gene_type:complete
MRIISGSLKGRTINFLKNSKTRPLKDSVRESIFNVLKHSNLINAVIDNSSILDLYSGVGSFGIECISRGAKKVTFIEHDIKAINILKKNLLSLSVVNKSKTHLSKIEHFLAKEVNEKFHIFFFDPPYKDFNFSQNLEMIKKNKIFEKNHIVIIHRDEKSKDELNSFLEVIETKKYGRSKIIFGVFN